MADYTSQQISRLMVPAGNPPPELRLDSFHAGPGPCHDAAQLDRLRSQHVSGHTLARHCQFPALISITLLKACNTRKCNMTAVPRPLQIRLVQQPHAARDASSPPNQLPQTWRCACRQHLATLSCTRARCKPRVGPCPVCTSTLLWGLQMHLTLCQPLLKLCDQLGLPHSRTLEACQGRRCSRLVLVIQRRLLRDAGHLQGGCILVACALRHKGTNLAVEDGQARSYQNMPSCTMTPYHGRVKATHNHGSADRCPPATQHCTDLECCSILCLCLLVCPLTLSPRYTLPGCHQLRHRTCRVSWCNTQLGPCHCAWMHHVTPASKDDVRDTPTVQQRPLTLACVQFCIRHCQQHNGGIVAGA